MGRCKGQAAAVTDADVGVGRLQMSDSEQVRLLFEGLTVTAVNIHGATNLQELEAALEDWFHTDSMSMTTFKQELRRCAICLGNCKHTTARRS